MCRLKCLGITASVLVLFFSSFAGLSAFAEEPTYSDHAVFSKQQKRPDVAAKDVQQIFGEYMNRSNAVLSTPVENVEEGETDNYVVRNVDVAGNRIVDLDARIKQDCINLKPDVLSILVGINGVAHDAVLQNGVGAEKFERVYDAMLDEIQAALPDCRLILMEPYLLRGPVTEAQWDIFLSETTLRQEIVARLAEKHGCALMRTQKLFSDAFERTGNALDWTQDGVHTSPAGAMLIAQEWLRIFREIMQ